MASETEGFTSSVVGVVVAIVVVAAVALPVINGLTTGDNPVVTDPTQVTIVKIIPVFLVLAILMMVIKSFMSKN